MIKTQDLSLCSHGKEERDWMFHMRKWRMKHTFPEFEGGHLRRRSFGLSSSKFAAHNLSILYRKLSWPTKLAMLVQAERYIQYRIEDEDLLSANSTDRIYHTTTTMLIVYTPAMAVLRDTCCVLYFSKFFIIYFLFFYPPSISKTS